MAVVLTFECLSYLVFAFWVLVILDRRRSSLAPDCFLEAERPDRIGKPFEPHPASAGVVAIVPARNEGVLIARTLPSLLRQSEVDVVLVDDNSSDDTGDVARQLASRPGFRQRLRVIKSDPTPQGWAGKVHAQSQGLTAAEAQRPDCGPEWILLTDADIEHRPHSIDSLLTKASEGPYELVSVMARLHAESFWERVLIPLFVYFFHLIYPFHRVSRPNSGVAAAAGGCILVRRETLERAGGLGAIRGDLIDDLALARAIRRVGGRIWLGLDPGISSIRPYNGLTGIWKMVSRNAFVQLRCRYGFLLGVLLGIAVFFVSPPVSLLVVATRALPGTFHDWAVGLVAILTWSLQTAALYPWVKYHRVPAFYAVSFPLGSLLYALMTVSSAWNHFRGRGSSWKGRNYKKEESAHEFARIRHE